MYRMLAKLHHDEVGISNGKIALLEKKFLRENVEMKGMCQLSLPDY